MFHCYLLRFPFFFPFVTEKDGKTCFNAEKNNFDLHCSLVEIHKKYQQKFKTLYAKCDYKN